MQSKLDAALYWAARGFRVFPVRANSRTPPILENWTVAATNDPATLRYWWTDPVTGAVQDHNPAILTNGLVVVDVDVKDGRRGIQTFYKLGLDFDTFTVRTPSQGYHVYYLGPNLALAYDLVESGSGIDIRAFNSYVLAPGATIDGVAYTVEIEAPILPAPNELLSLLKPPGEHRGSDLAPVVDLDTQIAIQTGTQWLEQVAPLAIEGAGGDTVTYEVCCRLRDFGVSAETSFMLLWEYWNDRCSPPWHPDELKRKIENAWNYARSVAGAAHPAAIYSGISIPEPEYIKPAVQEIAFGTLNGVDVIPPRPWLVPGLLMTGSVTALVSHGGVGKSTLILTILAHMAVGQDFLGYSFKRPMRSVLLSAEDDADENRRRLHAICQHFGFDFHFVNQQMAIVSGDLFPMQLTTGAPPTINKPHVEALLNATNSADVGVLGIDPLIEFHSAREEDNMQMRYVMSVIRHICRSTKTAALVAHHTSKARGSNSERAGSADSSRGASSIINSSRVAFTMFNADEEDCQRYGLKLSDRHLYARMDDAKSNYALAKTNHPIWLKRTSVKLYNGDNVGVLDGADVRTDAMIATKEMAHVLLAEMTGKGTASLAITEAARALMDGDPIYRTLPMATVRSRIERLLYAGVEVDGNRVVAIRDAAGVRVVLE